MGERDEREAAQLFDQCLSAITAGKEIDLEKVMRKCPVSERDNLMRAIRGAQFAAHSEESVLAPAEVLGRIAEGVRAIEARRRLAEEARRRLESQETQRSLGVDGIAAVLRTALGLSEAARPAPLQPAVAMYRGVPSAPSRSIRTDVYSRQAAKHGSRLWARMGCPDPPVDPWEAADMLGLVVIVRNLEGCDGCVVMSRDGGGIALNGRITNENRRRFTLAHEIGHFQLHRDRLPFVAESLRDIECGARSRREEEMEANSFASELLLPEDLVSPGFAHREPSFAAVDEMAELFGVSMTAAARRLVAISDFACAVVCTVDGRMRWFEKSEWFPYWLRTGVEPPADSDAAALCRGEAVRDYYWPTEAGWWTESRGAGSKEVLEHSRPAYGDYVLTLLYAKDVTG